MLCTVCWNHHGLARGLNKQRNDVLGCAGTGRVASGPCPYHGRAPLWSGARAGMGCQEPGATAPRGPLYYATTPPFPDPFSTHCERPNDNTRSPWGCDHPCPTQAINHHAPAAADPPRSPRPLLNPPPPPPANHPLLQLQQALMAPPNSPLAASAPAKAQAVVWAGAKGGTIRSRSQRGGAAPSTPGPAHPNHHHQQQQQQQMVVDEQGVSHGGAGEAPVGAQWDSRVGLTGTADVAAMEHYREVAQRVVAQRRRLQAEQREHEVG